MKASRRLIIAAMLFIFMNLMTAGTLSVLAAEATDSFEGVRGEVVFLLDTSE